MSAGLKSLAVFFTLLAASAFVLEWTTTEDATQLTGRDLLVLSDKDSIIPKGQTSRATFNGGTVSARLCAANQNGSCDYVPYAQAVGRMTIPAIILAPISFVAFWAFCFVRCCCNGFGGWERTPGNFCYGRLCCGRECYNRDFEGYSNASIWVVRIFYILLVIGLVAVVIPGFIGNNTLSKGVTRPGNVVVSFARGIVTRVNNTLDSLAALPYTKDANAGDVSAAFKQIDDFLKIGDDINGYIKQADGIRQPVYIVIMLLAPVVAIIGLVGAILGAWKVMFAAALLLFWVSTLIWIVFGIQYIFLIVFSDTCTELKIWDANTQSANATLSVDANAQVPPPATKSVFENLIPLTSCSNSTFDDLKKQANDGIDKAYAQACVQLNTLCTNATAQTQTFQDRPTCCSDKTSDSCASANYVASQYLCQMSNQYQTGGRQDINLCKMAVDAAGNMIVLDVNQNGTRLVGSITVPNINCYNKTIVDCVTGCNTSELRDISNMTLYNIAIQKAYLDVLYNQVFPLLSCFIFSPLIADMGDVVCQNLVTGMNLMEQVFLALAILLIPTTILAILAAKRWRVDSASGSSESGGANVEMQTSHDISKYAIPYQPSYTTKDDHPPAYDDHDSDRNPEPQPIGHQSEPYHGVEDHHHQDKAAEDYNPAYSPEPERLTPPQSYTPPEVRHHDHE